MPELPEVEALARHLTGKLAGREIERAELGSFSALKTFDPPLDAVAGHRIEGVGRRGKFLTFEIEDGPARWLIVHLSRAGWARWRDKFSESRIKQGKGPLALRLRLCDGGGVDVTEAGTEKRLAVWLVPDREHVEGIARLGPDPLLSPLSDDDLARRLRSSKHNVKAALTDQAMIAGIGNAYSDEILHLAHLSPYRAAAKLTDEEVATLNRAIVSVVTEAVERAVGLPDSELKADKKAGMRVHGRAGLPCPDCGDTVREVSLSTRTFQYCPTCQTAGKILADRRMSKLLK